MFQYFMDKCVACVPLNIPPYDANKRSVHQYFDLFTHVHMSKGWTKPVE